MNIKGTWSSLVYGVRLENEYFNKVVSSNLTVPVVINVFFIFFVLIMFIFIYYKCGLFLSKLIIFFIYNF